MAKRNETKLADRQEVADIKQVSRRLDMLDQRLDNIDSMVTAVAERVMKQPIAFNITCPHCGRNIEISIIGNERLTG